MSDPSMVKLAIPGTQPEYHFPPYVSSIARSPRMPLVLLARDADGENGTGVWAWFDSRAR